MNFLGLYYRMSIHQVRHLDRLKQMELDFDRMLLATGAVMALFQFRPNKDLDVLVPEDYFDELKNHPSLTHHKPDAGSSQDEYLTDQEGTVEIFHRLNCMKNFTVEELMDRGYNILGMKFMCLEDVVLWKISMYREKDVFDLEMIKDTVQNLQC